MTSSATSLPPLTLLFVVALLASLLLRFWLATRQMRHVAAHRDGVPAAGLYDRVLKEIERPLLQLSLAATRGNQIWAAELLGLNRNTLRKKLRELEIEVIRGLK